MTSLRTSDDVDWAVERVALADNAAVEHTVAEDAAAEDTAAADTDVEHTVAEEVFAVADRSPEVVAADTEPLWVLDGADGYKQAKAMIHSEPAATLAPSTAAVTE